MKKTNHGDTENTEEHGEDNLLVSSKVSKDRQTKTRFEQQSSSTEKICKNELDKATKGECFGGNVIAHLRFIRVPIRVYLRSRKFSFSSPCLSVFLCVSMVCLCISHLSVSFAYASGWDCCACRAN